MHTFNLSTRRQRQADLSEFEASLVYKASSRTARTVTHRETLSRKTKPKQTKPNKKMLEQKKKKLIHRLKVLADSELKEISRVVVAAHTFNPSTQEAEAGGSL